MPQEFSKEEVDIKFLEDLLKDDPNCFIYYVITGTFPPNTPSIPNFSFKIMKPSQYKMKYDYLLTQTDLFKNLKNEKELLHKAKYLLYRTKIIQELKNLSTKFLLSTQTLFLCIEYVDRICGKIDISNYEQFQALSLICLILAAKFNEPSNIGIDLENIFKKDISSDYKSDEIFILKLLNFDLIIFTPYDILIQVMNIGFFFKNEKVSEQLMNRIYPQLEKMLLALVESKLYVELSYKQIVFGIIGFVRESLNLIPFSEPLNLLYNLKTDFKDVNEDDQFYMDGLNKIRGCFKVKSHTKKK